MPGPVAPYSSERFARWHERHEFEPFSPQFNAVLVRTMCDPEVHDASRFMAWVTLYAGGNHSDWPVDPSGREKFRSDCEKETGMDRRRVSEAALFCARRRWVLLKGKRIIQADQANIERNFDEFLSGQVGQTPPKSFKTYKTVWLEKRPDKQAEVEQYRAGLKNIDLEILSDWERERETWEPPSETDGEDKENTASQAGTDLSGQVGQSVRDVPDNVSATGRTNGVPIIRTLEVEKKKSSSSRLNGSKQEGQSVSHQEPETDRPTHASYHERTKIRDVRDLLVRMLTGKLGETPKDGLCRRILTELKGAPPENLERRIVARYEAITSMGMCLHLAQDCGAAWAELQKATDKQKRRQEELQNKQWRDLVESVRLRWDTLSDEDRQWYHREHPEEFPA